MKFVAKVPRLMFMHRLTMVDIEAFQLATEGHYKTDNTYTKLEHAYKTQQFFP